MSVSLFEFSIRASLFIMVFLIIAYFLFRHIERIKKIYGEPDDKHNYIAILKHFFFKRS
jgi:hypothetical protein